MTNTAAKMGPAVRTALVALAMALTHVACEANERGPAAPPPNSAPEEHRVKIKISTGQKEITATLDAGAAARDFASLLPLTLVLEDYARTEKISGLPKRLSIEGAPAGTDPSVGDLAYYAPWGNLAIFYKDFGYSSGLVKLGRIDSGIEALRASGSLKVTIELAGSR